MHNLTSGLNPEQRKAVVTTEGPLLVLAGAGTGKTRVITHRIAYMLAKGTSGENILAMTFTNKAAGEMKGRIAALAPQTIGSLITVGTFHSFCVKSLRAYGDRIGVRKNFAICDAADQLVTMKNALRELRIPETTMHPKACISRVSLLKNKLVTPEQFLKKAVDDEDELVGRAYRRYNDALRRSGLLDFDDLLLKMVDLLRHEQTLREFRDRYRYVLVDEYQDTNGPQYEMVKRITGEHRNVCVVGDDDQSIYGWRGADVTKILNFEKDFPEAVVIRLETNYRSTAQILDAANAVIRHNGKRHEKTLRSYEGFGDPVEVVEVDDEEAEADHVVGEIARLVRKGGKRWGDFAILFRTQVQPRVFEMRLRQDQIPYVLVGGMSFFDRKEVRDVMAYLKLIANPEDEVSLLRIINTPPRGVGKTTVDKAMAIAADKGLTLSKVFADGNEYPELNQSAVAAVAKLRNILRELRPFAKSRSLVDMISLLLRDVNYKAEVVRCYSDEKTRNARWGAVNEILNMAENYARRNRDGDLAGLLEELTLSSTEDEEDDYGNAVTLMTLHAAKGLEFPRVYLVGAEEGLLPHIRSMQDGDVDEERRLAYVGITRAKQVLTISYTKTRARYGKRLKVMRSRFLYEMNNETPPLHELVAIMEQMSAGAREVAEKKQAAKDTAASAKGKKKKKKKKKKKSRKTAKRTAPKGKRSRAHEAAEVDEDATPRKKKEKKGRRTSKAGKKAKAKRKRAS
jgi:DNA helicase-2/ATP-dependent DNA helicase PcrA